MSSNTSFERLTGGQGPLQAPTHSITSPFAPTIVDPVAKLQATPRRRRAAMMQTGRAMGGLAGLGDFTDMLIANARGKPAAGPGARQGRQCDRQGPREPP
jgi:hypothetical protein